MAGFHQIAGFDVLGTLGTGAKSTLYEVRDKKGQSFCLKRVIKNGPSDQRFLDQAISEHELAKNFDHAVLRKSHRLIRQRALIKTTEVLVLMELIRGKTLEAQKPPGPAQFCAVLDKVADGLGAMHDAGYVHADLKPNNIMISTTGEVKVIDFGQSCAVGTRKERIQGTPDYIAPEQVHRKAITARTDVFNLGATMYWLLTGNFVPTLIPRGNDAGKLKVEAKRAPKPPAPLEIDSTLPPALSTLVMSCIESDPMDRPATMKQFKDRLAIAASQVGRAAASR
ncbi:MAG: serine/threonine-protein kinase [Planctomycetota bacterium]